MFTRQARLPVAFLSVLLLAWAADLPAQDPPVQWERVGAPETSALDVRALVVDSTGTLYAGTHGNGVWRSTDGDHWTAFNTGLTDLNIKKMILTSDGQSLFASTNSGGSLFRCRLNAGNTWEPMGSNSQPGFKAKPHRDALGYNDPAPHGYSYPYSPVTF